MCDLRKILPIIYNISMSEIVTAKCVSIEDENSRIEIERSILEKLKKIGTMDSTFSDVIEEILNHCDVCDRFVENRT